jgi:hypothetical protein
MDDGPWNIKYGQWSIVYGQVVQLFKESKERRNHGKN